MRLEKARQGFLTRLNKPFQAARTEPAPGDYERPPFNKSPGVNKPPPGGPRGGPEENGERDQHFAEIVGALRAQFFRSELMHMFFQQILEVSLVGTSKSG